MKLLAVVAALAPAVLAQNVRVYPDANFQGGEAIINFPAVPYGFCFQLREFSPVLDNSISSMKIDNGLFCEYYDDYFCQGVPDSNGAGPMPYIGNALNDKISSMKCHRV